MAVYTTAAALNAANLGTRVDRASATLPATRQTAYFHVYGGRCLVTLMLGVVTTLLQAQARNASGEIHPTTGTTHPM